MRLQQKLCFQNVIKPEKTLYCLFAILLYILTLSMLVKIALVDEWKNVFSILQSFTKVHY